MGITDSELLEILQELEMGDYSPRLRAMIYLALFSGFRATETAGARKKDFKSGRKWKELVIPWNAKKGNKMPAQIPEKSRANFRKISMDRKRHIFPGRTAKFIRRESVYRAWRRLQIRIWGHERYSYHDLRRRAITSKYLECGDLLETQKWARHKNYNTTLLYIDRDHPGVDSQKLMQQVFDLASNQNFQQL